MKRVYTCNTCSECSQILNKVYVSFKDLQVLLYDDRILNNKNKMYCLNHYLEKKSCAVCDTSITDKINLTPRHVKDKLYVLVCDECRDDLDWILPYAEDENC